MGPTLNTDLSASVVAIAATGADKSALERVAIFPMLSDAG
jgi:hypothetical protein